MQKIMNAEVAEILGAFTGDGWIENRGGAMYICGHSVDDKAYYDNYLGPLVSKWFTSVNPKKFEYWHVYGISIYKKDIIAKMLDIGFQKGKKCYTAMIPDWIKNGDISLQIAFLRGLFDTDGCVWFEKTKVNKILQPRLSIISCSEKLIKECGVILARLEVKCEIRRRLNISQTRNNNPYSELRIRTKDNLKKWFEIIGTNNKKHRRKYEQISKSKTQIFL